MSSTHRQIIDSHHHLWNYRSEDFGWIDPQSRLAQDFLLPDLATETKQTGITGTVVVQARQTLEESDWLLSLAESSDLIRGVVGWFPLARANVEEELTRRSQYSKLKGVRHVLQDEPLQMFSSADFHRGLRLLPQFNLSYDLLLFAHQLDAGIRLVDLQPDLPIIVDHIAKPAITQGRICPDWLKGMRELARRNNVVGIKLSGMVTEVQDEKLDSATLHAYMETVTELFQTERVMFGSDWPVCLLRLDSLSEWVDCVNDFTQKLSSDEQKAIFHDTACKVYQLSQ